MKNTKPLNRRISSDKERTSSDEVIRQARKMRKKVKRLVTVEEVQKAIEQGRA